MERWHSKVAVVTGASSGIGAAIVKDLIKFGLIVVGLARRKERLIELQKNLPKNLQVNMHPIECDITSKKDVKNSFQWIENNLNGIDILINNAGIYRPIELVDENSSEIVNQVIATNITAVVDCTREAFKSMKKRDVYGHVVLINSIIGHRIPQPMPNGPPLGMYPSSKFAITAMTEVFRQEFLRVGKKIKITSISPGTVNTEIFPVEIKKFMENSPMLQPEDVSNAVMYVLGTPPHVQVHELTIKPMGEQV